VGIGLTFTLKFHRIITMIKIVRNSNFAGIFDIFAFDQFIEQVQGEAKALRFAKRIARKNSISFVVLDGETINTSL